MFLICPAEFTQFIVYKEMSKKNALKYHSCNKNSDSATPSFQNRNYIPAMSFFDKEFPSRKKIPPCKGDFPSAMENPMTGISFL